MDMTVILERSGAVILGVPRTGSRWVTAACQAAVPGCRPMWGHPRPGQFPGRPLAVFTRHPVSWLDSMHRDGSALSRHLGWDVPSRKGRSLEEWVRAEILTRPGCVGGFFRQWTVPGVVTGRQESLAGDLIRLLRGFGETVDEAAVHAMAGTRIGASPGAETAWPPDLARQVAAAEGAFIAGFCR